MFNKNTIIGLVIGSLIVPINTFLVNSYYKHEKYVQDQLNGLPVEYRNAIEACSCDGLKLSWMIHDNTNSFGKINGEQYKFIMNECDGIQWGAKWDDTSLMQELDSHLDIEGN